MARKGSAKQAGQPTSSRRAPSRGSKKAGAVKRGSRQRRKEAAQRARRRRQLRLTVIVAVLSVAVAGIGWQIYQSFRADAELQAALTAGTYAYDQNSDSGSEHVSNPDYEVNPPAGGSHLSSPAQAGNYSGESAPPDGALVHAMEHGLVILWHRPDLNRDGKAALKAIAAKFPSEVIIVERESMPTRVAATAWHQRLVGDSVERKALTRFIREFRNKGPESVS